MRVEESLNVTFDKSHPPPKTTPLEDDDLVEEAIKLRQVMEWYPDLDNGQYDIVDRVMRPLALVQEQKVRKDREIKKGRHSTSSSFAFHHGSSSHQFDDDEEIQDEAFGRHLEEIHVTWTQFGKKQDKIATLHEDDQVLAHSAWRRHHNPL
ncbi:hypothetical protein Tco_0742217 [Tanacetum coccineum]